MLKELFKRKPSLCETEMNNLNLTLKNSYIDTFKQKIISFSDYKKSAPYAHEILNRNNGNSGFFSTGEFYSFAASHGQIHKVDTYVIKLALERLNQSIIETQLSQNYFLNVHLSSLFSEDWELIFPYLIESPFSIVLELSEREGLGKYSQKEVGYKIAEIRDKGVKIAVDDIGKGYSGLITLAMVQPDFVKIDRDLVGDIEKDRYRQHMMKALVSYWLDEGVNIIAEGVEKEEEAQFFSELGTQYGQGYLFHLPEKV